MSVAQTAWERPISTDGEGGSPSHSYPYASCRPLLLPSLMHHLLGQLGPAVWPYFALAISVSLFWDETDIYVDGH